MRQTGSYSCYMYLSLDNALSFLRMSTVHPVCICRTTGLLHCTLFRELTGSLHEPRAGLVTIVILAESPLATIVTMIATIVNS